MNLQQRAALVATVLAMLLPTTQSFAQTTTPPVSQQAQSLTNQILAASPPFTGDAALGCKILLCLANPNGPEAVAECVQPIETLWHILNQTPPGQIPVCPMASTPGNKNYAVQTINYYSACPAGTTPLAAGAQAALQGQPVVVSYSNGGDDGPQISLTGVYTGIGDGEGLTPSYGGDSGYVPLQPMTCVGTQVGMTKPQGGAFWLGDSGQSIPVYDKVVVIQPGNDGRAIDVFINNALHNVVHY